MKTAILFPFAALVLGAQAPLKVAAVNPPPASTSIRQSVAGTEKLLDGKIAQVGGKDHVYVLGLTRGLYLAGYGAVFTQEIDLIESAGISPFHQQVSAQEAASNHQRRLANLAVLRKAMRDMWVDAAASLPNIPENEQVVLAVRLLFRPGEDTNGLPTQIVVKGARKAAPGTLQMEEQ